MANTEYYHATELAYVLSYLRASAVVGWGSEPFTPPKGKTDAFLKDGLARLRRNRRLVPGKQPGRERFADATSRLGATLADPQIALVTYRRDGDVVRQLTHYVAGTHVVELGRGHDEMFAVVEHASLSGAVGAAAAFVGVSERSVANPARLEANRKVFERVKLTAQQGNPGPALAAFVRLGASRAAAESALSAFLDPVASGVVSVMYCTGNVAQDAVSYVVCTNKAQESWLTFAPESADGPVLLENTSLSALIARILVGVAANVASSA